MTEPIMVTVVSALVTWATTAVAQGGSNAVKSWAQLIRNRFQSRPADLVIVEGTLSTQVQPAQTTQAVELLRQEAKRDPEFARQLIALWRAVGTSGSSDDSVTNQVSGDVEGTVIQARDVFGGIQMHGRTD
ncbi:hypothetical protein [Solwaraspora sp. WMMD792]|uniref:hypothetical protein n=1 Tax=Solwaraspora sp. WMMD792 TaxID=3016099 RepID=UPI002416F53C|nr:hypothetical protein [Solwaraspora sp. WMMD792]MDG4773904.1 hypothetical protein [Solwaraspora sp. WMMD792]